MKKLIFLLMLIALYSASSAQSYTGTVEYLKLSRQAILNDVSCPENIVAEAIQDNLERQGYRAKESKGFIMFKGVRLPVFINEPFDLFFSINRKSKKEKEISTITMILSRGGEEFVTQGADREIIENAKIYLNSLTSYIDAYYLEQQIKEQEEVVKKNEKKENNLVDDGEELQKKKKKIEKDIDDNKKDQADQKKEVENQKQILESLKNKRKE